MPGPALRGLRPFDFTRSELAREFKAAPYGPHSPDLQALLNYMRSAPLWGNYFLFLSKPHREWTLARYSGGPPLFYTITGPSFTRIEDAEWHVFKARWERLAGRKLELD